MVRTGSVASQYSWRLRDQRGDRVRTRRVRLTVGALFLLALLAALAWVFYLLWNARYTYFGVLAVGEYDAFAVPQLPYQDQTQADLRALSELQQRVNGWRNLLKEDTQIKTLERHIHDCGAGHRDAVVLYLGMHGLSHFDSISQRNTAYLAQSEFFGPEQKSGQDFEKGLHKLSGLLETLAASDAGLKLLILDAGRIAYDPRLGIVANTFPELAERAVADLQDNRVWVLLSHGPGQISGSDSRAKRSLFAESVAAGLRGDADAHGDGNELLTLAEFYTYVWNATRDRFGNGEPLQTPQLLRGGKGAVGYTEAESCSVLLADVSPPPESSDDTQPTKNAEKKDAVPEPAPQGAQSRRVRRNSSRQLAVASPAFGQAPDSVPPPGVPAEEAKPASSAVSSEAAKKAPVPPAQSDQNGASDQSKSSSTTSAATAPQPPPVAPAKPESKAPAGDAENGEQTPRQLLGQAWKLHNSLTDSPPDTWSPVDFAPAEWRRVEALLIQDEARVRAGILPQHLAERCDSLEKLAAELQDPGNRYDKYRAEVKEVADAWRLFRDSPQKIALDKPRLHDTKAAWQLYCRTLYDMPYFIRWQAHKLVFLGQTDIPRADVKAMDECLTRLRLLRDEMRQGQVSLTREVEDRLGSICNDLQESREDLRLSLAGSVAKLTTPCPTPELDRHVDSLLETPLLGASRRAEVLRLASLGKQPQELLDLGRDPKETAASSSQPTAALRTIVNWELAFWELCDAPSVGVIRKDWEASPRSSEDDFAALGENFRRHFPEAAPPPPDATRDFSSLAWLLDPRDNRRNDSRVAAPLVQVPPPDALLQITQIPATLQLDRDSRRPDGIEGTEIAVQFRAEGLVDSEVDAYLTPDKPLVRIEHNGKVVNPTAPLKWTANADQPYLVYLTPLPESATRDERQVNLKIRLSGRSARDNTDIATSASVICELPPPFDVAAWVRLGNAPRDQFEPEHTVGTVLRPYPNRETVFQILLENRCERPKRVRVDLYQIPAQRVASPDTTADKSSWAPGWIFVDDQLREGVSEAVFQDPRQQRNPLRDLRKLAEAEVDLPAESGQREPVNFQAPGSLQAAADTPQPAADTGATPAPAAPPAPTPQAPANVDVSEGMFMIVTNVKEPSERVVRWLGIRHRLPRDYVNIEFARQSPDRFDVGFALRNKELIPGIADRPVEIEWSNSPDAKPLTKGPTVKLGGNPTRAADAVLRDDNGSLGAKFPPAVRGSVMNVTVDDYPRAFSFRIGGQGDSKPVDLWDMRDAVRCTIVGVLPQYEELPPSSGGAAPTPPPSIPITDYLPPVNGEVVVPTAGERRCIQIRVKLEVDVPDNSSEGRAPGHMILLNRISLYRDRQVLAELTGIKEGLLQVKTTVRDWERAIDVVGQPQLELTAELRRSREQELLRRVKVIIDSVEPRIESIELLQENVVLKQDVPVSIRCEDDNSGLKELVVALDVNGSGQIEETDFQTTVAPTTSTGSISHGARLSTAKFEDPKKLDSQGYHVLAQAQDRAGNKSAVFKSPRRVIVSPPMSASPKKLTQGTIWGTLQNTQGKATPFNRAQVKIKGLSIPAKLDGAVFRFDDVPIPASGGYTLEATGSFQGYPVEGQANDVIPKDPAKATPNDVGIVLDTPSDDKDS